MKKSYITEAEKEKLRINRNIVECKYKHILALLQRSRELIETLWNVN